MNIYLSYIAIFLFDLLWLLLIMKYDIVYLLDKIVQVWMYVLVCNNQLVMVLKSEPFNNNKIFKMA